MKKFDKEKFFRRYISNFVIVMMLGIVAMVTLNLGSVGVASTSIDDVVYQGNRESSYVSLMFNVYWGTEYIPEILSTLEKYNVKTTFFVGGTWAEKEQSSLKMIYDHGHEIGNHGYFHKDQGNLNYEENYSEISVTHKLINSIIGIDMNLFAPPSGSFNNSTIESAKNLGYTTIMWSKDTIDWRDKDSNLVYSRATNNTKGGELILMHPTAHTLEALPKILDYFVAHDIIPTTVTKTIN